MQTFKKNTYTPNNAQQQNHHKQHHKHTTKIFKNYTSNITKEYFWKTFQQNQNHIYLCFNTLFLKVENFYKTHEKFLRQKYQNL